MPPTGRPACSIVPSCGSGRWTRRADAGVFARVARRDQPAQLVAQRIAVGERRRAERGHGLGHLGRTGSVRILGQHPEDRGLEVGIALGRGAPRTAEAARSTWACITVKVEP